MRRRRAAGSVIEVIKADRPGSRRQPFTGLVALVVCGQRFPDLRTRSAGEAGSGWCGGDLEFHREAGADREALTDSETADVVGVDAVLVLDPGGTEAGEGVTFELARGEVHAAGAAGLDELLRGRHRMQQDRLRRTDDPGRRFRAAHPFGELRAEDGGDTEAARPLDDVDESLPGLGDRGELIDDQQHPLWARLAADGPLRELLDEEAGEVAGLVFEPQPVEQEVGGVELVEGDVPSSAPETVVKKAA